MEGRGKSTARTRDEIRERREFRIRFDRGAHGLTAFKVREKISQWPRAEAMHLLG
jgi:hypothetical protein